MGIVNWLLRRDGAASESAPLQTRQAVERILKLSPQLRLASRHQERLGSAVAHSLKHIGKLVETLPPPLEASPAGWADDAQVHAFFATADDVAQVMSRSADLRDYFDQHPAEDEAIAVLSMAITKRRGLGVKQEGGMVRTDVARTTVSFHDHLVRLCCGSVDALRQALVELVIDQLAIEGLARIEADTSRRDELEQERALLKARVQLLERGSVGMHSLAGSGSTARPTAGPTGKLTELARVQAQIDENEQRLARLGQKADALPRQLELVCAVLADPAAHVDVTTQRLRLNRMNTLVDDNSLEAGTPIEFRMARIPGNPSRTRALALVRVKRADLLPAASFAAEAKHFVI
ncbi:hypothetical protein FAZ69_20990 [Trinickia terrae]|uniref:Uncharacterized protein n=1 Tax=Trinickia terrae TaxID=2571161 RepID=A0A4U1HZH5_9BURK|nr:hypothetical protein [Trinickia terrae]TKC86327.1 hypothetical protein FAZ69_20990 [Trinickia terrae]